MLTTENIQDLQKKVALHGDLKAYKELYFLFITPLCRFSFSFVKSQEAAEEIVSDVFIKIWEMKGQLAQIDNLRIYLYTATKNLSLNYVARTMKSPLVSFAELDAGLAVEWRNPETVLVSSETIASIRLAVNSLPPQCRTIFQLVKEDGLRYKEVAEILNISVFTVRNQVAIAIRKVADILPGHRKAVVRFRENFSAS